MTRQEFIKKYRCHSIPKGIAKGRSGKRLVERMGDFFRFLLSISRVSRCMPKTRDKRNIEKLKEMIYKTNAFDFYTPDAHSSS